MEPQMETIERLMRDAREKGAEERRPAVAKLGELAKEGSLKRQAIEALMKLLRLPSKCWKRLIFRSLFGDRIM